MSAPACDVCGLSFVDRDRSWDACACLDCGGTHGLCSFCRIVFQTERGRLEVGACPDECRAAAEVLGLSGPSSRWPINRIPASGAAR